jgi:hypothetical protein
LWVHTAYVEAGGTESSIAAIAVTFCRDDGVAPGAGSPYAAGSAEVARAAAVFAALPAAARNATCDPTTAAARLAGEDWDQVAV